MKYETAVEIDADRNVIWDKLADVERWPEWTASVTSVQRLDSGHLAVESRVRIKQPRMPAMVWTITAFEPGREFS